MARKSTKTAPPVDEVAAILEQARELGLTENYFFNTTFRRYQTQISILEKIEKELATAPIIVEKTYGGVANQYTNPLIADYNKTAQGANGTVTTLCKIMAQAQQQAPAKDAAPASPLAELMASL